MPKVFGISKSSVNNHQISKISCWILIEWLTAMRIDNILFLLCIFLVNLQNLLPALRIISGSDVIHNRFSAMYSIHVWYNIYIPRTKSTEASQEKEIPFISGEYKLFYNYVLYEWLDKSPFSVTTYFWMTRGPTQFCWVQLCEVNISALHLVLLCRFK